MAIITVCHAMVFYEGWGVMGDSIHDPRDSGDSGGRAGLGGDSRVGYRSMHALSILSSPVGMRSSVASSMHLFSLEGNGRSWRRLCNGRSWRRLCNGRYNGLLASPQNCTACALFGVSSRTAAAAVSRDRALRHRTVSRRAGSTPSAVLSITRVSAVLSSTRASACARTVL